MTNLPFEKWPLIKKIYWPNTFFLIITPLLVLTLAPWHIYSQGLRWELLLFLFIYSVITSLSITAGYHRLFSHRSYETRQWVKFLYLVFGAAQFQGSALKWCSDHRRHHKFVDTDADPYTIKKGFFYAHMGWVFLKENPDLDTSFEKDLSRDPLVQWQNDHYVPLAVFTGFLIPMGIGALLGSPWGGLIFAGFARVVLTQHCTFFINSFCHYMGRKPFSDENTARDSFVMALFTYGEGYHNFHHKFQGDYRNGIRWFDWDPTKWLIRAMNWLGLARSLKRVPPNEILKARLSMQEKLLLNKGAPPEKLSYLRQRIHDSYHHLRRLKDEYNLRKNEWKKTQRDQLMNLKAETRLAQLEFQFALRQWKKASKAL